MAHGRVQCRGQGVFTAAAFRSCRHGGQGWRGHDSHDSHAQKLIFLIFIPQQRLTPTTVKLNCFPRKSYNRNFSSKLPLRLDHSPIAAPWHPPRRSCTCAASRSCTSTAVLWCVCQGEWRGYGVLTAPRRRRPHAPSSRRVDSRCARPIDRNYPDDCATNHCQVHVEKSPSEPDRKRIYNDDEFTAVGATLVEDQSWPDAPKE
jgi:hypothetical protein